MWQFGVFFTIMILKLKNIAKILTICKIFCNNEKLCYTIFIGDML